MERGWFSVSSNADESVKMYCAEGSAWALGATILHQSGGTEVADDCALWKFELDKDKETYRIKNKKTN